ncbi:MAG: hypothetical protein N2Z21_03535 [Candidatus Sumerlaeaceae bacterium]|nr:hypothetical protein [Candidatus Sumerlaeaceae bacterium]
MLGFADVWVFLAYVLTILVTLAAIVYGWLNWNKEGEEPAPLPEEIQWEQEEEKIDESLG